MKFHELLKQLDDRAVFIPQVEGVNRRSTTRWLNQGLLIRLRRGLYQVTERDPHPFMIANLLDPTSHISGPSALTYLGYAKETLQETVFSVTRRRSMNLALAGFQFTFQKLNLKLPVLESPFRIAPAEAALLEWMRADRLRVGGLGKRAQRGLNFNRIPLRYDLFEPGILVGLARETGGERLQDQAAWFNLSVYRDRRFAHNEKARHRLLPHPILDSEQTARPAATQG